MRSPPGVAIEDWTGVHYIGSEVHKVIASKRSARAYQMRAVYGSVQEVPLASEYLENKDVPPASD